MAAEDRRDDNPDQVEDAAEESETVEKTEGLQKSEQDKGKEEYNKGNYAEAVKAWSTSLKSVKYIIKQGCYKDQPEQLEEVNQILLRTNLNMSQGSLKLGDWRKAIEYADAVLEVDKIHAKALYRKAAALIELGELKEGIVALEELLKHEDNPAAKALLAKANRSAVEADRKSKKAAKRMFANLGTDPRVPPTRSEQLFAILRNAPEQAWNFVEDLRWRAFDLRRDIMRQVQEFVYRPVHSIRRRCKAFITALRGIVEAIVPRSKEGKEA